MAGVDSPRVAHRSCNSCSPSLPRYGVQRKADENQREAQSEKTRREAALRQGPLNPADVPLRPVVKRVALLRPLKY